MKKKGNALGDFLHRSWLTLDRDLTGLRLLIKLRWDMRRRMRENRGLHLIFMDVVKANPNKICIVDIASNRSYTFSQLNSLSNRFANHFLSKGYGRGDIVALFMENGIEFVAAWIGLMKIGVITAWINSNLRMDSLAHCLKVSECKAIICSESLYQFYIKSKESVLELQNIQEFLINNSNKELNLNTKWLNNELDNEPIYDNSINFHSLLCFIYTSGTTGMPKPACIKHFRCYSMVVGCAYSFGILTTDRIYISMPLYHTAAGILGIGQVLFRGASCAIRQRFSASNFWKDCVDYECTASQYIGEICRYLLAQPIGESEKNIKFV
ncbi:AMP-binding domain-containing protein [Meloidogyne graminicola]|uniref:Long-chain-fatty-acid--CoA ligase n=1 Tax=Meloidogyne graminicola TaxID=189291 RepID=A0A8S9ZP22_9BILA|nr:AMP-binding domain-containing protein [Meloidogyne graminicola]